MANVQLDDDEGASTYVPVGREVVSPNSGTKTYYPIVPGSSIPEVGMVFDNLNAAYKFYKAYALAGGFSPRKTTQYAPGGVVKLKYFVCSKEGFKTTKAVDTLNLDDEQIKKVERRRPSKRTGCPAKICLSLLDDGKYKIYLVVEGHNHPFVAEDDVHLLTASRELTLVQKHIIKGLSDINIGPVRAFNIMRTMYGGFDRVGFTKSDCKNFKRNINTYIADNDAEMVIQRLVRKRDFLPNYSCDYLTCVNGTLKCLFWADEDSKRNYYTFGDVVSFDATYRHNKYKMVFVPFTGIDNHNRNVTLGAAIIGSETADTYRWLLNCYKKAFGYEPQVVVTDQDPAMKRAIEDVFPNSRHRFCMWHIMDKLSTKVGSKLCNNTDFKRRLCDIVWTDSISPEDFEREWSSIMSDFHLTEHEWLSDIYGLRQMWIPAYYRNENMSGLMRTSSRSESENHFFGKFCNATCTLVEFFSHYESAIELQRYEHRKNDHDTRYTRPDTWSDFPLEKQAIDIFTRAIFFDVQLEIEGAIEKCVSAKYDQVGNDFIKFYIKDFSQPTTEFFEVMFRLEDVTVSCSCKRFEQFGLLCCHAFFVLRFLEIKEFPKQYILRRWTREAVPNSSLHALGNKAGTSDSGPDIMGVVRDINQVHDNVINLLVSDMEKLSHYREYVNQYLTKVNEIQVVAPPPSKRDRYAELIGMSKPSKVTIRVPIGIRNKGSGVHKRMKSIREQVKSQAGKPPRECKRCKKHGHDTRNCKKVNPLFVPKDGANSSQGNNLDE